MELRRLISFARAWLPPMVLAAALAGSAGFAVSTFQPNVYEAKATLIVGQALSVANPDYNEILVARDLTSTYAAVAKTRPLLASVVEELKLDVTPGELAEQLKVDAPGTSTFLTISAQDTDPERAAAIANALSEQLIAASPTIQGREAEFYQSIDAGLSATQDLIDATQSRLETLIAGEDRTNEQQLELETLEGRIASLRSTYATLLSFSSGTATNLLAVVEPADPPTFPVSPRPLLNGLLAAAIGLLSIMGIAYLAHQLDDSLKDADAVHEVAGLSTLGTIEEMRGNRGRSEIYRLPTILNPRSRAAEAYRALRANVEFTAVDAPVRTILVTSTAPGEGKTVTASNLAVVFAQSGRTVLLVDADLRRPGVDAIFRLANTRGLTTMLLNASLGVDDVAHSTEQDNLRVVTAGALPPNPADLLGSQRMQAVLNILRQHSDVVIFDSPPLHSVTDAAILSSMVDGTLLVVDADSSRKRLVRMACVTLARTRANVLGVVLNRVPAESQFGYDGYHDPPNDSAEIPIPRASAAPSRLSER